MGAALSYIPKSISQIHLSGLFQAEPPLSERRCGNLGLMDNSSNTLSNYANICLHKKQNFERCTKTSKKTKQKKQRTIGFGVAQHLITNACEFRVTLQGVYLVTDITFFEKNIYRPIFLMLRQSPFTI